MEVIHKKEIEAPPSADMRTVLGQADELLRIIERMFDTSILVRGNSVQLEGSDIELEALTTLFNELFLLSSKQDAIAVNELEHLIELVRGHDIAPKALREDIVLSHRGKVIRPKTAGQKQFIDAIRMHSITFGLGPAGTGKTFLACALAVDALKRREVSRIVLTRPIVEAGESLGFLPGSMMEKVDPYIRPLYDALFDLMDPDKAARYLDDGTIEITPLAFMRGRTFNDSFVILDEAQNTTQEQMKMFLTRLGFGSKMVITGDESQSDNPRGPLGIKSAKERLCHIEDIAFATLTGADVVRHSLVAQIVAAYEGT